MQNENKKERKNESRGHNSTNISIGWLKELISHANYTAISSEIVEKVSSFILHQHVTDRHITLPLQ